MFCPSGLYVIAKIQCAGIGLSDSNVCLTDNPNGGTEFYFQDLYIPAEKGKTIIWPAEWMYTHKGRPDMEKEKMIITGWMEFTQKGMGELT